MPDVQVCNRNSFPLAGRYDGQAYTVPARGSLSMPEEAANHIFGLTAENKTGALNRLGLLKPGGTLQEALKALDKVTFVQGHTVFESPEPLPPPTEPEPDHEDDDEPSNGDQIGGSPGAQPGPGGEPEALSASGALAREVLSLRRGKKLPIGG